MKKLFGLYIIMFFINTLDARRYITPFTIHLYNNTNCDHIMIETRIPQEPNDYRVPITMQSVESRAMKNKEELIIQSNQLFTDNEDLATLFFKWSPCKNNKVLPPALLHKPMPMNTITLHQNDDSIITIQQGDMLFRYPRNGIIEISLQPNNTYEIINYKILRQ